MQTNTLVVSKFSLGSRKLSTRTELEVKNEPMLFNNDWSHAMQQGGEITKEFLQALPNDWQNDSIVVDSRVHMLMPGWYPCIPGWHHDDVIRTRSDGQPDYNNIEFYTEHIMMLVNADICPTEFLQDTAVFQIPEIGKTIYKEWDAEIEHKRKSNLLITWSAPDRQLVHFNDRTWHRGTPAVANGRRFFIRASKYWQLNSATLRNEPSTRQNPRTNEIRKQVQVYMPVINQGW